MTVEGIRDLLWTEKGRLTFFGMIFFAVIILVVIHIIIFIFDRTIEKAIVSKEKNKSRSRGRLLTLSKLSTSLLRYLLYIFGAFVYLDLLKINTRAFLATAGVGSLAIAMGSQTLVKDFIQGCFILFEDQYSVGDLIECAGKEGYVQEVGVRVTKLRHFDGSLYIIPNSEIRVVTNKSRGQMRAKVVVTIDQGEEPTRVLDIFEKAMDPLRDKDKPGNGPNIWGVTNNLERGYEITIVGYAPPGEHYDLEFEVRKAIIEAMKRENIAQPKWILTEGGKNGQ